MACNEKCSVYSRVTGYYRPVENWNRGKQEEFRDRKTYDYLESLKRVKEAESKEEETK